MLTVKTIIEVIGFPSDHVDKTLLQIIEKLEREDGIRIINKEIAKAKQMKKFFSAFVELELDIDNLQKVVHFCLDYHPSSIEIMDKERLHIERLELTNSLNDLLATLHRYNMITKNLEAQLMLSKKNSTSGK